MTCFYCKGDMEDSRTTHFTDLGKCIVIIKNVPYKKCVQCGEVVYSGNTLKTIEKIINILENMFTEIAIVDFQDKIA